MLEPKKSPEWEAVYQPPRSTVASRNGLLKSARNNGLGDSTARLMRGWAAQLFHIALGVVGVNFGLVSRWLRKGDNNDDWTDPPRHQTQRTWTIFLCVSWLT